MTVREFGKACLFLLFFGFLLVSLTYILRTNGEVKDIFTGFYAEEENSIDVCLIGSSPVYPFYGAPGIWGKYGITSFPLSSHVQRPSAALPLLKEVYKTQSPKVVVFEMRMFTMEDGDMESNMAYARGVTDNMKYSWNRIDAINRLVADKGERYTYYFDIFKYHSNWKTLILPEQIACITYEKSHPLKGYAIKDGVGPLEKERIPDSSKMTGTFPMPAEQEERLSELLDYLKEQKQEALFLVSPYRVEEQEQKMFRYMASIVEDAGYRFLNLNDYYKEIGIDFETDYYDYGGHVNTLGAVKCTDFLGGILSKEYGIPDKRHVTESSFSAYQSWEEAYGWYQEKVSAALAKIEDSIRKGEFAER